MNNGQDTEEPINLAALDYTELVKLYYQESKRVDFLDAQHHEAKQNLRKIDLMISQAQNAETMEETKNDKVSDSSPSAISS